jgi:hypothetical protein
MMNCFFEFGNLRIVEVIHMAKNGNTANNQNKNRTQNHQAGNMQSRNNTGNMSVEFSEEFCSKNDSRKSSSCDKK